MAEPLELARRKWYSSGLADEVAEMLELRALSPDETRSLAPNFHRAASLWIPYFTLDGELSEFYRIRYLESLPGFAGAAKKPIRFHQPPNTLNEVYFPPLLKITWRDIAVSPDIPIYITEGELKAAAGCLVQVPTMGLGGVDVWRSAKRGLDALPALKEIAWNNRQVSIVFDSDASHNPDVIRAQVQLSHYLTAQGAKVGIISLPAAPEGKKQGLDDFLVREGEEALVNALSRVEEFPEASALWKMNEEVVYIKDPGLLVVRDSGLKINATAFVQHAYANRHYEEIVATKQGVKKTKKPLAPHWLSWENRFQLDRITYQPGAPQIVDNKWNTWKGWGCAPKKGDIQPWKWLLRYLFNETNQAYMEWFEKWCAYPFQHPGEKLFSAVVMWGRHQGTGKTLIAYTLRQMYGDDNFREIKNKDLKDRFNDWAENRQFIYGDEITGGDKRVDADWLKGLLTQERIMIHAKYLPSFILPDCISYYFTSNHPDAFFFEDTDRRYFVHEVVRSPAEQSFYRVYDQWLHGDGPSALFDYFLHLDLKGFDPKGPAPVTDSKRRMAADSKSDAGIWVQNLIEDTEVVLTPFGQKVAIECDLFTSQQIYTLFTEGDKSRVSMNGLSRELKRAGCFQVNQGRPIRVGNSLQRMFVIRNFENWATASPYACAQHWSQFFGGGKT